MLSVAKHDSEKLESPRSQVTIDNVGLDDLRGYDTPMQITLNLDDNLLNEAFQLTNLTTQEELLNLALRELVQSRRKKNLLDLAGQIQLAPEFDHKALRETRHAVD